MDIIQVSNVELPNGGLYSGEAIDRQWGGIEISGQGKVVNPDGSSYEGQWKYNRPNGFGLYKFADGDFHKGFFDDTPHGPGYLCLNTTHAMRIGQFSMGRMNGWAISFQNGSYNCSFLSNGRVIQDHTSDFSWMFNLLQYKVQKSWKGNLVQCSADNGYIRLGAPNRTGTMGVTKFERHAIGFLFTNDGCMYVGLIKDVKNLNGWLVKCTPDHKITAGIWEQNRLVKEDKMEEIDAWTDMQLSVEQYTNIIIEKPSENDDLPF